MGAFFSKKFSADGEVDLEESERVYFDDFARTFAVFRQVNKTQGKLNSLNSKEHKVLILVLDPHSRPEARTDVWNLMHQRVLSLFSIN